MSAESVIGTEEGRAAGRLIEKACTILPGIAEGIPASFAVQLFGRVVPEDLVRYEPRELAAFAARAFDFLQKRKPGAPKIRIESPPAAAVGVFKPHSVLQTLHDPPPPP